MNAVPKMLLILHPDPLISAGLEAIFRIHAEFEVIVGSSLPATRRVDVVVADLANGMNIAVAERVLPVIIVASDDGEASIRQALAAGVRGYWLPGTSVESLVDSARVVARGGFTVDPRASQKMLDRWNDEQLTKREEAVLGLLVRGLSDKEMASRLGCATGTIKCHLKQVRQKLRAKSRTHAIFIAQHRGLLPRAKTGNSDVPSDREDRSLLGLHGRPAPRSRALRSNSIHVL